jgi:hypothetical protein
MIVSRWEDRLWHSACIIVAWIEIRPCKTTNEQSFTEIAKAYVQILEHCIHGENYRGHSERLRVGNTGLFQEKRQTHMKLIEVTTGDPLAPWPQEVPFPTIHTLCPTLHTHLKVGTTRTTKRDISLIKHIRITLSSLTQLVSPRRDPSLGWQHAFAPQQL